MDSRAMELTEADLVEMKRMLKEEIIPDMIKDRKLGLNDTIKTLEEKLDTDDFTYSDVDKVKKAYERAKKNDQVTNEVQENVEKILDKAERKKQAFFNSLPEELQEFVHELEDVAPMINASFDNQMEEVLEGLSKTKSEEEADLLLSRVVSRLFFKPQINKSESAEDNNDCKPRLG